MMNNILKAYIISSIMVFIQWRSWEHLVLKNFAKICRQHLCLHEPQGHWCKSKPFYSSMHSLIAVLKYLWKWVLCALPQPHQKTFCLWRLAHMPCAHRDFGQRKAAFKDDKAVFRRTKEERKQSFLTKRSNNRGLSATVTPLCRSGFMLLPVSFMLAL